MPPNIWSRHRFSTAHTDAQGRRFLSLPERYGYRQLSDNRTHVVKEGDTLWGLAAIYFRGVERPAGLWWVIADFQPEPIHDPTIALSAGRILFIPSVRTVLELILNERRRRA